MSGSAYKWVCSRSIFVDSLLIDSLLIDSLLINSLLINSLFIDSLLISCSQSSKLFLEYGCLI